MLNPQGVRLALLLAIILGVGALSASAAPILSIEPASQAVQPGQSVSLKIDIASVTDLYAWQFDLTFDPAVLAAMSVTEGAFLAGVGSTFFTEGMIDNTGGGIAATADTLIGAISGATGSGTLATVVFQALASGTSPVTLANVMLLDSSLTDITGSTTIDGTVSVNAGTSAVPEPATWLMLATGLAGLMGYRWCGRHAAHV